MDNSMTQIRKRQRHEFLLTFFSPNPQYQVKEVNGWTLVKQFNAANQLWEVAIYTKENWAKVEKWKRDKEAGNQPLPMA
jgi:hypothetical protein